MANSPFGIGELRPVGPLGHQHVPPSQGCRVGHFPDRFTQS